ncbi:hypothetical protein [Caenispirillum bisanense]|uniref:hypothetical protein n=1 Tax=Caenispirillum bisanense TaxID=414052 RepID=UPI0031DC1596
MSPVALLLALGLALPAVAQDVGGDKVLSADGLADLLAGGAAWDFRAPGSTGSQSFAADGTARIVWQRRDGSGGGESAGQWRQDGDTLCVRWDRLGQGKESCVRFFAFGAGVWRTLDARTNDDRAVFMPPGTSQD